AAAAAAERSAEQHGADAQRAREAEREGRARWAVERGAMVLAGSEGGGGEASGAALERLERDLQERTQLLEQMTAARDAEEQTPGEGSQERDLAGVVAAMHFASLMARNLDQRSRELRAAQSESARLRLYQESVDRLAAAEEGVRGDPSERLEEAVRRAEEERDAAQSEARVAEAAGAAATAAWVGARRAAGEGDALARRLRAQVHDLQVQKRAWDKQVRALRTESVAGETAAAQVLSLSLHILRCCNLRYVVA
ncbi:hypothetical protein T484DRAFT_1828448, partial [Baffinella frigidus]